MDARILKILKIIGIVVLIIIVVWIVLIIVRWILWENLKSLVKQKTGGELKDPARLNNYWIVDVVNDIIYLFNTRQKIEAGD